MLRIKPIWKSLLLDIQIKHGIFGVQLELNSRRTGKRCRHIFCARFLQISATLRGDCKDTTLLASNAWGVWMILTYLWNEGSCPLLLALHLALVVAFVSLTKLVIPELNWSQVRRPWCSQPILYCTMLAVYRSIDVAFTWKNDWLSWLLDVLLPATFSLSFFWLVSARVWKLVAHYLWLKVSFMKVLVSTPLFLVIFISLQGAFLTCFLYLETQRRFLTEESFDAWVRTLNGAIAGGNKKIGSFWEVYFSSAPWVWGAKRIPSWQHQPILSLWNHILKIFSVKFRLTLLHHRFQRSN